ncbi:amino acid permease 2 [Striga asiatica]|uniref:Amino acid permease 2 n=1 Tax=Striga asiatica TaxID=4170 RepID=A0A5A7Q685_STRAF|nr:amino acid permease 2 [Striga asiatica]
MGTPGYFRRNSPGMRRLSPLYSKKLRFFSKICDQRELTPGLMRNMCEKRGNLAPSNIRGPCPELRKSRSGVEPSPRTIRRGPINDSVEKGIGHDIRKISPSLGTVARAGLAPGAAVRVPCAAIAPTAAAEVVGTTAVLGRGPLSPGNQKEGQGKKPANWGKRFFCSEEIHVVCLCVGLQGEG